MKNQRNFQTKSYLSLILISLLFLFSCTKVEEEYIPSTYTFKYSVNDYAGLSIDITLFEFNNLGEKIGTNSINNCKNGTMKTFTANKMAEKVKIFYILRTGTVSSTGKWVQQVFYLNKSDKATIEMTNNSIVGSNEP